MPKTLQNTKPDPTALTPRLRLILAVVLLADVLDLMDSTITNLAAPTIVRDIGGGEALIKWLGAGYALAMGVLLVVGGRLGDRFGKRRMFLVGIAGFTAASLVCGLAADPAMLIVARVVQGGFGALLIPQGIGILLATFSREQLPRAFVAFGPVLGGSAVLGPVVAGLIIDADLGGLGWRPIFLINIVLGAVGFVAGRRLVPADDGSADVSIDGVGAGLLAAAMFGAMYGLIEGSTDGWTVLPVALIVGGVVAFVAFGVRQRTARSPLIVPSLLANRGFTSGLIVGLAFFAAVNGLAYVVALFLQSALELTPAQASLGLSPLMVGIIAASFVSRPLVDKIGRTLVVVGLAVTALGGAAVWLTVLVADTGTTAWTLAPSVLVLGAGMGACFASIYDVAVGDVAPEEAGGASGSLSAVQQLASGIGSALVTTIYFDQAATHGLFHAMTVSVFTVTLIVITCLGLVRLMPRRAPAEGAH